MTDQTKGMNNNEEPSTSQEEEISAECVLPDVMKYILKYLNTKDLCNAKQVCRSWNEAVEHELSMRGPEIIMLPVLEDTRHAKKGFHPGDVMRSRPHVLISFYKPSHLLESEHYYLLAYKNKLPRYWLLVSSNVAMYNEHETCSTKMPHRGFEETLSSIPGVPGISLPMPRNGLIKIADCCSTGERSEFEAERMVREVMFPEVQTGKTALLIFGRTYYETATLMADKIRKIYKPNSYTLWGSHHNGIMRILNCPVTNYPKYMGMEGAIIIALRGVESHSFVVSALLPFDAIEMELADFRNRINSRRLKRHSAGLVYVPRCFHDRRDEPIDMMLPLRKVFPEVNFTACFSASYLDENSCSFGFDSTKDVAEQKLTHSEVVSIMILSYN